MLFNAIKKLTSSQQDLIERIYYNNEKQKDIAKELGVSPAAITNHLNKIYKQLKKHDLRND